MWICQLACSQRVNLTYLDKAYCAAAFNFYSMSGLEMVFQKSGVSKSEHVERFFFLFSNHRKELGLRKLWFKKMSWACDPLWNWYNLWLYFWICLICPHFRGFFLFFLVLHCFQKQQNIIMILTFVWPWPFHFTWKGEFGEHLLLLRQFLGVVF